MKSKIIPITIALLLVSNAFIWVKMFPAKEEFAYVDLVKIFHEFDFKKELEKDYLTITSRNQALLDSLGVELEILKEKIQLSADKRESEIYFSQMQMKWQEYQKKSELYKGQEDNMRLGYDEQVLTRLKEYLQEFGQRNNVKIIFGLMEQSQVIYAEEQKDLTQPAIHYINNRYNDRI